jgi:SPP1 family predicted phage head-tail adaptor
MNLDSVRIGALRHRITVQNKSASSDGMGGQTYSWSNVTTLWSRIEPVSAKKRFFGQKLEPVISHRIYLRYYTPLSVSMRIMFGSRIFQIHSVISPDENKEWTILECQEGAGS